MHPPHPNPKPKLQTPNSLLPNSRSTDLNTKKTVFIGWRGICKTNFARPQQLADEIYRLDMHRQHELVDKAVAVSTSVRDKTASRQDPLAIADEAMPPHIFEAMRI